MCDQLEEKIKTRLSLEETQVNVSLRRIKPSHQTIQRELLLLNYDDGI